MLARAEDYFGAQDLVGGVLDIDPDDAPALALASYMYLKQEAVNEGMAIALRALIVDGELTGRHLRPRRRLREAPGSGDALPRASSPRSPRRSHATRCRTSCSPSRSWGCSATARPRTSYRRAVALDPACVRARFGLAAAYLTEGRHAEASWEIRRAAYYDTKRQGLFWRLYDDYAAGGEER